MVAPYATILNIAAGHRHRETQIPVTNPIERLNGKIKRRSEVVGIFPNGDAIADLIDATLSSRTTNVRSRRPLHDAGKHRAIKR